MGLATHSFLRIIPTFYTRGQKRVFKSTDHGQSWTQISGDLTRNDKCKQQPSGGPLTNDITAVEYYDTVFALAESPVKKGMLWAGTDDGLVHVTTDDGAALVERHAKDAGVEHSQPDRSVAARRQHRLCRRGSASTRRLQAIHFQNDRPGQDWSAITNGIPDGAYVHAVREDPKKRGLLYAGTELGVFVSFDDGAHWQPLQLNLPVSPIHDLVVKDDDLVVATHGRSFWVSRRPDAAAPGQRAISRKADMNLYQPQTAVRLHYPEEFDKRQPVGENPPPGAMINYYFKTAPKDEVSLDILDASGKARQASFQQREKRRRTAA